MTVLADTSIWVDYWRKGRTNGTIAHLDQLLARKSVVTCGPVIAELFAGALQRDRAELWLILGGLPLADLDRDGWRRVGEVAADLRRVGNTVALTDISIAVASVLAGLPVWSTDGDFQRIRQVLPQLELYDPNTAAGLAD